MIYGKLFIIVCVYLNLFTLNVNGVNLRQDSDDIFAKTIDDNNLTQVIEYINYSNLPEKDFEKILINYEKLSTKNKFFIKQIIRERLDRFEYDEYKNNKNNQNNETNSIIKQLNKNRNIIYKFIEKEDIWDDIFFKLNKRNPI
tara:strand:- start:267 stop:695 length:429 start_codon:yes stop_codon:yes gene_type:complete